MVYSLSFETWSKESLKKELDAGTRSKIFDPGWVNYLWFGFGYGKFPLKNTNISIFSLLVKKIPLDRVKKYLGQRWVGLLFTAGQEYVRVGLDQGPSLLDDHSGFVQKCYIKNTF